MFSLRPGRRAGGESLGGVVSEPGLRGGGIAFLVGVDDICNDRGMAKTVIVKLTDDLDGGDADESVTFALEGRTYEIDLSAANAVRLREALRPFIERARVKGGTAARHAPATKSLYSQLADDEKARFRSWADMATARRISDERVEGWIAAGKP